MSPAKDPSGKPVWPTSTESDGLAGKTTPRVTPRSGTVQRPSAGRAAANASASLYERYKDALRRGHVAALRGRNDAAIDAYGEAASIAPDRALPHASIGGILMKMDRTEDAAASYGRALALAPRDEVALRGIAEAQVRLGRRTDAAESLDQLAEVLDGAGRLADATDAARRSLELAESRTRRAHVEALTDRLRTASPGDEAAERALTQAMRLLEPAAAAAVVAEPNADAPADESAAEADAAAAAPAEPPAEPDLSPVPEPIGLGIALGAVAEAHLYAGELEEAHAGLLTAARAHRRAGRLVAAVDACYLAIGLAPADPDLHLLLAELYLDRGWRTQAADKLLLLDRIAQLDEDTATHQRLCDLVASRLADEPRVAALCA